MSWSTRPSRPRSGPTASRSVGSPAEGLQGQRGFRFLADIFVHFHQLFFFFLHCKMFIKCEYKIILYFSYKLSVKLANSENNYFMKLFWLSFSLLCTRLTSLCIKMCFQHIGSYTPFNKQHICNSYVPFTGKTKRVWNIRGNKLNILAGMYFYLFFYHG